MIVVINYDNFVIGENKNAWNFKKLKIIGTSVTVPSACFPKDHSYLTGTPDLPLMGALKYIE